MTIHVTVKVVDRDRNDGKIPWEERLKDELGWSDEDCLAARNY